MATTARHESRAPSELEEHEELEPPAGRLRAALIAAVCCPVLVVFGAPAEFLPHSALGAGLDPSYVFAIGRLASMPEIAPGRDWVFPFGPLGHWLMPPATGTALYASAAARVVCHLGFVGTVLIAGRRHPGRLLGATAGWLAAVALGLGLPAALILVVALLWSVPGRYAPARWCLGAALAPVLVFVRTHLALAAVAVLVVALVTRALTRGAGERAGRQVLVPLATAAASAVSCVWVLFPSPHAFLSWCAGQLELAVGYGAAMSLPGEPTVLATAVVLLVLWAALVLLAWLRRWSSLSWWVLLAVPVALAFRHSFVRADDHVLLFFPFLAAAAALGLLFATGRAELACVVAALALMLGTGVLALHARERLIDPGGAFARRLDSWAALLHPSETAAWYQRLDRERLAPEVLPEAFAAPLRAPDVTTDVVPYELSIVAANELAWRPNPTLQLYTAYTPALDRRVAAHFASTRAPEALLFHFGRVVDRNPFWDTPETWRAILAGFRFEAVAPDRALVLLRRRAQPRRWSFASLATFEAPLGEWVELPPAPDGFGFVFAEIRARPTLSGRASALLLRTAPIHAEVVLAGGQRRRYRLVPGTAAGGVLLDPMPRGAGAVELIVRGQPAPRAERLRFVAPNGKRSWRGARVELLAGRLGRVVAPTTPPR